MTVINGTTIKDGALTKEGGMAQQLRNKSQLCPGVIPDFFFKTVSLCVALVVLEVNV